MSYANNITKPIHFVCIEIEEHKQKNVSRHTAYEHKSLKKLNI
jgi:hypothetical protein